MRARINFDENGYVSHFVVDPNGDYEIDDDLNFEFLYCYHLVGGEIVLDEEKRVSQIAEEQKETEIADLQLKLNGTDYIISRTFEEIMALDNSVTFVVEFIKILKEFRTKYAEQLKNRKSWRQRIEELKGE